MTSSWPEAHHLVTRRLRERNIAKPVWLNSPTIQRPTRVSIAAHTSIARENTNHEITTANIRPYSSPSRHSDTASATQITAAASAPPRLRYKRGNAGIALTARSEERVDNLRRS